MICFDSNFNVSYIEIYSETSKNTCEVCDYNNDYQNGEKEFAHI